MRLACMLHPSGIVPVGLQVADSPRRSMENVGELDLGYPGKHADAASRTSRADDEQALPRQVDLLLQVGQHCRLGYRIRDEVDGESVQVHPVEQQDRGTERLSVG